MPVNIVIGLVALLVALVLYSMAAWGGFRAKGLTRRHVNLLWVGLVFDVIATAMMAIQAGGLDLEPLADLAHTVLAFVVFFGMLALAIAGMRALASDDRARAGVARWALVPWVAWVLVFVWGMLARGSERMG